MKHFAFAVITGLALGACTPTEPPSAPAADGVITSAEYQAQGWTAKTLPELSDALESGEVSAVEVTQAYLERIESVDRAGPTLQSILSLNPDAR